MIFHRQPARGDVICAILFGLKPQAEWIEAQQHGFSERAEEGDRERRGADEDQNEKHASKSAVSAKERRAESEHEECHAARLGHGDGHGAESEEIAHIEAGSAGEVQIGNVDAEAAAHAGEAAPVEELEGIAIGPGGEVVGIAETEECAGLDVESAEEAELAK